MSPPDPGLLSTHVSLPAALTGNLSVSCFRGGAPGLTGRPGMGDGGGQHGPGGQ